MKKPTILPITETATMQLAGYPSIFVEVHGDCEGSPADLILSGSFGRITKLSHFADRGPRSSGKCQFPVLLEYYSAPNPQPFLFLIGLFEVWFVSSALVPWQCARLYRAEEHDRGFFNLVIHEQPDFFLIRYESGLCKCHYDGTTSWHIALRWDDVFVREDEGYFIYSNEFTNKGKEFKIHLDSGKIATD